MLLRWYPDWNVAFSHVWYFKKCFSYLEFRDFSFSFYLHAVLGKKSHQKNNKFSLKWSILKVHTVCSNIVSRTVLAIGSKNLCCVVKRGTVGNHHEHILALVIPSASLQANGHEMLSMVHSERQSQLPNVLFAGSVGLTGWFRVSKVSKNTQLPKHSPNLFGYMLPDIIKAYIRYF